MRMCPGMSSTGPPVDDRRTSITPAAVPPLSIRATSSRASFLPFSVACRLSSAAIFVAMCAFGVSISQPSTLRSGSTYRMSAPTSRSSLVPSLDS